MVSADWNTIKAEYITDDTSSYRKLAQKYGVSRATLEHRAKVEGWSDSKRQHKGKVMAETLKNVKKEEVNRVTRLLSVSDKLLSRIEKIVADDDCEISPATIDILAKSLKNIKEVQRNEKEDERTQIKVIFGDSGEDYSI